MPVNVPEAPSHPAFSFRPETGEEAYHSMLAVPVQRGGVVLGVIAVQNRTPRHYTEEDVEVLETTAMLVADTPRYSISEPPGRDTSIDSSAPAPV